MQINTAQREIPSFSRRSAGTERFLYRGGIVWSQIVTHGGHRYAPQFTHCWGRFARGQRRAALLAELSSRAADTAAPSGTRSLDTRCARSAHNSTTMAVWGDLGTSSGRSAAPGSITAGPPEERCGIAGTSLQRGFSDKTHPVSASVARGPRCAPFVVVRCASKGVTIDSNSRRSRQVCKSPVAPPGAVVTLMVRSRAPNAPQGGRERARSDALTGLKPTATPLRSTRIRVENKQERETHGRRRPSDSQSMKPKVATLRSRRRRGAPRPVPPYAGSASGGQLRTEAATCREVIR
jgi:hypothetical protein